MTNNRQNHIPTPASIAQSLCSHDVQLVLNDPPPPDTPITHEYDKPIEEHIMVAVRARPLNKKERLLAVSQLDRGKHSIVFQKHGNVVVLLDPNCSILERGPRERAYQFHHVFDVDATNDEVYKHAVQGVVQTVLNGFNATCFAYGVTGAGKTHTMIGKWKHQKIKGIYSLAAEDIFDAISKIDNREIKVFASFLEIYNERIKDLLCADHTDRKVPRMQEDPRHGVRVLNVTQFLVNDASQLDELIRQGNTRRTTIATRSNKTSSRSHAVLQLTIHTTPISKNDDLDEQVAKLSLIDLAGSERAAYFNSDSNRKNSEGSSINRSLLALGKCIIILGELANSPFKHRYVPYRDSKLTFLLKDSLGGNTRTTMIANVSPSFIAFEETLNTLKYASRAACIKRVITPNNQNDKIRHYKQIIAALQSEIQYLREVLKKTGSPTLKKSLPLDVNYDSKNVQNEDRNRSSSKFSPKSKIKKKQEEYIKFQMNLPPRPTSPLNIRSTISEVESELRELDTTPTGYEKILTETESMRSPIIYDINSDYVTSSDVRRTIENDIDFDKLSQIYNERKRMENQMNQLSPNLESPKMESPKMESPKMESPKMESRNDNTFFSQFRNRVSKLRNVKIKSPTFPLREQTVMKTPDSIIEWVDSLDATKRLINSALSNENLSPPKTFSLHSPLSRLWSHENLRQSFDRCNELREALAQLEFTYRDVKKKYFFIKADIQRLRQLYKNATNEEEKKSLKTEIFCQISELENVKKEIKMNKTTKHALESQLRSEEELQERFANHMEEEEWTNKVNQVEEERFANLGEEEEEWTNKANHEDEEEEWTNKAKSLHSQLQTYLKEAMTITSEEVSDDNLSDYSDVNNV